MRCRLKKYLLPGLASAQLQRTPSFSAGVTGGYTTQGIPAHTAVCYKIPMQLNLLSLQHNSFLGVATVPLTFSSHKMKLHLIMTHLYANRLLQSNVHA